MAQSNQFRVGDQPLVPIRNRSRGRTRIFEYGPATRTSTPAGIPRITTSDIRIGVINRGTTRRRVDIGTRLGLDETNKSVLCRRVVKGIRQPGRVAPNYSSPLD